MLKLFCYEKLPKKKEKEKITFENQSCKRTDKHMLETEKCFESKQGPKSPKVKLCSEYVYGSL